MDAETAPDEAPPPLALHSINPQFTDNARRARFGVAYMRSICAQAGVGFTETSPDEDNLAIDGAIEFTRISVRVQIKCTSRFQVAGKRATLDLEPSWVENWSQNLVPTYIVLVKVPPAIPDWIVHNAGTTRHHAIAYWVKFDPGQHQTKMVFRATQRLTVDTLHQWRDDTYAYLNGVTGGRP